MSDQYWSPAKQDPAAVPFRNKFDQSRDPLTARNAIGAAGLESPVFTGDPQVPTPAPGDNDTSIATTEFVTDAIAALAPVWTAYTPTVMSGTGVFTSVSATGKYLTVGKLTHVQVTIVITTNGTAASYIQATLPNTASGSAGVAGREIAINGKTVGGQLISNTMVIANYDGTYAGVNGATFVLSTTYENV